MLVPKKCTAVFFQPGPPRRKQLCIQPVPSIPQSGDRLTIFCFLFRFSGAQPYWPTSFERGLAYFHQRVVNSLCVSRQSIVWPVYNFRRAVAIPATVGYSLEGPTKPGRHTKVRLEAGAVPDLCWLIGSISPFYHVCVLYICYIVYNMIIVFSVNTFGRYSLRSWAQLKFILQQPGQRFKKKQFNQESNA